MDLLFAARPDEPQLSKTFGVRPPSMFLRFVQWVYDRCDGDPDRADTLYWKLIGLRSSLNTLYAGTPVELFAVGDTGGDGEHAGFVVMAPELPADDYPWMNYAPAGNTLDFLAPDTPTFLAQVLSYTLVADPDPSIVAAAKDAAAHLGLKIHAEAGRHRGNLGRLAYWELGVPKPTYPPPIPPGYHFQPAKDDVGVLAPAGMFAPRHPDHLTKGKELGPLFDEVERLLASRHPATALLLLRSPLAIWESMYSDRYAPLHLDYLRQAYRDLGRPVLADRVGIGE